jgi:hypothetical protein
MNNGYPFLTKSQISARLDADEDFRNECLVILYNRQTSDEQDTKDTKYKNRRGFMSSHAVHGSRIAQAIMAGEALSDEDRGRVESIVCRYTKQLAAHFRAVSKAENPELADAASIFGV